MHRLFPLLLLMTAGCAGIGSYPSLGTYHVDDARLVVLALETSDTLAILSWADTLEVIDAPLVERTSDDLFIVRCAAGIGRADRDAIMSDLLFRSRYTHGRSIRRTPAGRHYYLDEFADTVFIRRRNVEVARMPVAGSGPAAPPGPAVPPGPSASRRAIPPQ